MITIQTQSDGVLFNFQDSTRYLYGDGSILTPYNSLTLIADESNVLTFRKSASNDIFITAGYDELGYSSKEEAINDLKTKLFKPTGGGSGSGMTPSEVQEMIDESVSGKADTATVNQIANEATQAILSVSGGVQTNASNIADIWDTIDLKEEVIASALTEVRQDVAEIDAKEEVIASALTEVRQDVNTLSGDVADKQDALQYYSENISDKTANIHIENTEFGTLAEVFADDQSVDMYASRTEEIEGSTVKTNTDISNNPDGVAMTYGKLTDDEDTAHSYLNVEEGIISAEVYANEETTRFEITPIDVTINDERVLTEGDVDNALNSGSTNPVANSAITQALENKLDASAYTQTDLSQYWTSAQTQTAIDGVKAYYISFATIATTGIRDEDWDGIVAAIDDHRPIYAGYPRNNGGILYYGVECMNKNGDNTQIVLTSSDDSSHYFYTFTKNGSNDYTFTSETRPYVTDAEKVTWNAKQDALSAGTGIEISGNVISATGGGGATYSAGTNISIDTANTISCTLPIYSGTGDASVKMGYNVGVIQCTASGQGAMAHGQNTTASGGFSHSEGNSTTASGSHSHAEGFYCRAGGNYSHAEGNYVSTNNESEHSQGTYNVSNTGSTASGKTLFSVGNGNYQGYHNALDIRQNGDIYFPDTDNTTYQNDYEKPMVRLQDMYAALGGLKLVKLTQSEYDNLATKDNDTLYIISNVVS